jgi:hypothetical protein
MHKHNGYAIELRSGPTVAAICTKPESDHLVLSGNTKAEALYAAIRAIDAREIAHQIGEALSPIEGHDVAIDQVIELVHRLTVLVNG